MQTKRSMYDPFRSKHKTKQNKQTKQKNRIKKKKHIKKKNLIDLLKRCYGKKQIHVAALLLKCCNGQKQIQTAAPKQNIKKKTIPSLPQVLICMC